MSTTEAPATGNLYRVIGLPCPVRFVEYGTRIETSYWTDPIDPEDGDEDVDVYEETEEVEDWDWAYVVMAGDDTRHLVEVSEMTLIPEDEEEFCPTCHSLTCAWHA